MQFELLTTAFARLVQVPCRCSEGLQSALCAVDMNGPNPTLVHPAANGVKEYNLSDAAFASNDCYLETAAVVVSLLSLCWAFADPRMRACAIR